MKLVGCTLNQMFFFFPFIYTLLFNMLQRVLLQQRSVTCRIPLVAATKVPRSFIRSRHVAAKIPVTSSSSIQSKADTQEQQFFDNDAVPVSVLEEPKIESPSLSTQIQPCDYVEVFTK